MMFYVMLFHSIFAVENGWKEFNLTHHYEPVMVNGEPVSGKEYPWMASLRVDYPEYVFGSGSSVVYYNRFCGGSLISVDPITILTTAHCLETFEYDNDKKAITEEGKIVNFFIDLGRTKGPFLNNDYDESEDTFVTLFISNFNFIHIHPQWDTDNVDIAVIIFNDNQTALPGNYPFVSIPGQISSNQACCQKGDQLIAIGYGATEDTKEGGVPTDALQRITMTYQSSQNKQIAAIGNRNKGQDVCSGDSGGPLFRILNDESMEVVGITSYTITIGDGDFCNSEHPIAATSYFTSTAHFSHWMHRTIIHSKNPSVNMFDRPVIPLGPSRNNESENEFHLWGLELTLVVFFALITLRVVKLLACHFIRRRRRRQGQHRRDSNDA